MERRKPNHGCTYHIWLKETLVHPIDDWLDEVVLVPQEDGRTLLVGQFFDQSALRGFLNHLWNLNLTVLSVERMQDDDPA